jgi:uncharacterized protein YfkK (UPF0435 family)
MKQCEFINQIGAKCNILFESNNDQEEFCPAHTGTPNTQNIAAKQTYISLLNEEMQICAKMTDSELDFHIAEIEKQVQILKTKLHTSSSIRQSRIEDLDEDQRKKRLKELRSQTSPTIPKKNSTAGRLSEKDPIGDLAKKYGITREKAEELLND